MLPQSAPQAGLSPRGENIRQRGTIRDHYDAIWANPYHPEMNRDGTINLGTAENATMLDDVTSYIQNNVSLIPGDIDYGEGPWGSQRLRTAMASHMSKWFRSRTPVDPAELFFSTGCTSICEMLGFALFEPGDGLLLSRPVYQGFQSDFGTRAGVKSVFVSNLGMDQFGPDSVPAWEAVLAETEAGGVKVRAMVLINPHNPLGRCYSPEALIAYMHFAQKHSIHLIVDEIYALSIYDVPQTDYEEVPVPFTSVLALDWEQHIDRTYLHVMYGFSKDFAAGGLRLGVLWSRNKGLLQALERQALMCWPSAFCEAAAATMLEDQEWVGRFIATSRRRLGERAALARHVLEEHGIPYVKGSIAGFFLWVDVRQALANVTGKSVKDLSWDDEHDFKERVKRAGVYVTPGEWLASEEPGYLRLCFVKSETELRTGLQRLFVALEVKEQLLTEVQDLKLRA